MPVCRCGETGRDRAQPDAACCGPAGVAKPGATGRDLGAACCDPAGVAKPGAIGRSVLRPCGCGETGRDRAQPGAACCGPAGVAKPGATGHNRAQRAAALRVGSFVGGYTLLGRSRPPTLLPSHGWYAIIARASKQHWTKSLCAVHSAKIVILMSLIRVSYMLAIQFDGAVNAHTVPNASQPMSVSSPSVLRL